MSFFDGFGEWVSLGTVSVSNEWSMFPLPTHQGDSFRLSWKGKFEESFSQVYLREMFLSEGYILPSSEWIRLYPNSEPSLLYIPFLSTFHFQQGRRFLEVKKKTSRIGFDPAFSLKIEEFKPHENL